MASIDRDILIHAACARHVYPEGISTHIASVYPGYFFQKVSKLESLGLRVFHRYSTTGRGLYTYGTTKYTLRSFSRAYASVYGENNRRVLPHSVFIGPDTYFLYMLFVELGALVTPAFKYIPKQETLVHRSTVYNGVPFLDFNLYGYTEDSAYRLAAWFTTYYDLDSSHIIREDGCMHVRVVGLDYITKYIATVQDYVTADIQRVVALVDLMNREIETCQLSKELQKDVRFRRR